MQSKHPIEKWLKWKEAGYSTAIIGQAFGVSKNTVVGALDRYKRSLTRVSKPRRKPGPYFNCGHPREGNSYLGNPRCIICTRAYQREYDKRKYYDQGISKHGKKAS